MSWGKNLGLVAIILISWGIALFEYILQVPANRIGFKENGGPFSLMELKVMESNDKWYGVTYQEDKPIVQAAFKNLIEKGVYPNPLW